MLARQLRYNIDIYKPSNDNSSYGAVNYDDYVLDYSTRAGIKYGGGGEGSNDNYIKDTQTLTFLIRDRKDKSIDSSCQIRWNGDKYNIVEVIPKFDGIFKQLELKAEKTN